jgi:SAM-dependent methyltransferase
MSTYVLETGDRELARLTFQHEVWGPVTERFLDRLGLRPGSRILDLGCGPGLVLESLARRAGPTGSVVALDESPKWIERLERLGDRGELPSVPGSARIRCVRARLEELPFPPGSFDLIFARWVLSFPPGIDRVVRRLAELLSPGGVLAVEDYQHEGIALFPESEGLRAAVRATRAWYASRGGDAFVAARLPGWMRAAGLEIIDQTPHVLCGGPDSPAFRWAGAFFPHYSAALEEQGLLSTAERARFLAEWAAAEANPDAMFFSPMVVDLAARRRSAEASSAAAGGASRGG